MHSYKNNVHKITKLNTKMSTNIGKKCQAKKYKNKRKHHHWHITHIVTFHSVTQNFTTELSVQVHNN